MHEMPILRPHNEAQIVVFDISVDSSPSVRFVARVKRGHNHTSVESSFARVLNNIFHTPWAKAKFSNKRTCSKSSFSHVV